MENTEMSNCSWCGNEIIGEPKYTYESGPLVHGDGDKETEIMPAYKADFCCSGCEWAFLAENHRLFGISGKELRNHLVDIHELTYPPGKPAGVMRNDCIIVSVARNLAKIFD